MQDKTKPDKVITEEIKIIMKVRIFPTENQSRQSAKGRTQPRGRRRVEKGDQLPQLIPCGAASH